MKNIEPARSFRPENVVICGAGALETGPPTEYRSLLTNGRGSLAARKAEVLFDQPDVADLRSRLAAIVDSSNDAIISKNLDGVISTWNLAAQRLFGYSEAEAIGQPITIIIPADLHDEEKDLLGRVRVGDRIEHHETRRVTRDGRTWMSPSPSRR